MQGFGHPLTFTGLGIAGVSCPLLGFHSLPPSPSAAFGRCMGPISTPDKGKVERQMGLGGVSQDLLSRVVLLSPWLLGTWKRCVGRSGVRRGSWKKWGQLFSGSTFPVCLSICLSVHLSISAGAGSLLISLPVCPSLAPVPSSLCLYCFYPRLLETQVCWTLYPLWDHGIAAWAPGTAAAVGCCG